MASEDNGLRVNVNKEISISIEHEEVFPVRVNEWERIRKRLQALESKGAELSAAAWACVGVFISAVFAMLSWFPAWRDLTIPERASMAWMWPVLIALGVTGVILAVGMFWASHVVGGQKKATIEAVLEDMDFIRPPTTGGARADVSSALPETVQDHAKRQFWSAMGTQLAQATRPPEKT
ncbi:MAG: hypothetical protein ACTIA6_17135 [Pseudoclavibacter sp.]